MPDQSNKSETLEEMLERRARLMREASEKLQLANHHQRRAAQLLCVASVLMVLAMLVKLIFGA